MPLNFNIKSSEQSSRGIRIEASITWKGHRMRYATGLHCPDASRWDKAKQRLKPDRPLTAETIRINNRLAEIERAHNAIAHTITADTTKDEIIKAIDDAALNTEKKTTVPRTQTDLVAYVELYLSQRRESPRYKRGTDKNLGVCLRHIKVYSPVLPWAAITWRWRQGFENYLFRAGLSINYVAKMLDIVKQFLTAAAEDKITDVNIHLHRRWNLKKVKVPKFYLGFDELEVLYRTELADTYDDLARTHLIIGAFTGLRFSDFKRLRPEHFSISDDGIEILTIRQQKTGQSVVIPVMPILRAILVRYNYKVPRMVDQVFNRHIKEACRLAGLDKQVVNIDTRGGLAKEVFVPKYSVISSHAGRRSFATNFYLAGFPLRMIQQVLGHSTERQTLQYLCMDAADNAAAMARLIAQNPMVKHLKVV